MKLPSPEEYRSALQHPEVAFAGNAQLATARAEEKRHGIPLVFSGNFTATFHLLSEAQEWAVRCYTREVSRVSERYDAISRFLERQADPAMTSARYIRDGIAVNAERYGIIQMEWITGSLLNDHVNELVEANRVEEIAKLADAILDIGLRLERLGIAHGDIQHGNVLFDRAGQLRLVDYDDMFLPELASLRFPSGIGHDNFQHPGRESGDYNEKLDRFPVISIYLTLRALASKPSLWESHDGGDDALLFRRSDFVNPRSSALLRELCTIGPVRELVDRFSSICENSYQEIPSLQDFVDGRFLYSHFTPRLKKKPDIAAPRSVSFSPEGAPVAGRRVEPMTVVGLASVLVVIGLTVVGILTRRVEPLAPHLPGPTKVTRRIEYTRPARRSINSQRTITNRIVMRAPAPHAAATHVPVSGVIASPTVVAPMIAPRAVATAALAKPSATSACTTPDGPPRVVVLASPQLSDEKRAAAAGKTVAIDVDVAANGSVTGAAVQNSANDVTLDFAALNAARESTYAAGERACASLGGVVHVTVSY